MSNSKPAKPLVDTAFTAEVARFYESTLVPLIFETYAHDLAIRASNIPSKSILEVACGTGVVTRALSKVLPDDCLITATDLNDAMVRHAEKLGAGREVDWAQADVKPLRMRHLILVGFWTSSIGKSKNFGQNQNLEAGPWPSEPSWPMSAT